MVGSMLTAVMSEIDDRFNHQGESQLIGVPTGFRDLDDLTLGMQGGQLIIVGARPGMGKSAFALNVAENAARATGRMALFFSMEMGIRQLTFRTLAGAAGVNVQRLYTGRIREPEWPRISDAVGVLQDMPIAFCERADVRMADIRSLARRAKREFGGISVIVVDYLQLMLGADSEANRSAQLSEITRGLKVMAKELDVPVMALSQLNRELEKRGNKRPITADLRDSGAIEQDADNIFFIYRDEAYNPNSPDKGIAEIIVAKQRDGPTGTIRLSFRADHTRFGNYGGEGVRVAA
jgi:replicative DNA helicase